MPIRTNADYYRKVGGQVAHEMEALAVAAHIFGAETRVDGKYTLRQRIEELTDALVLLVSIIKALEGQPKAVKYLLTNDWFGKGREVTEYFMNNGY